MAASDDPRLVAIRNFAAVLDGRSLDAVVALSGSGLDDKARALASELSFGLCRWYRQLHAIVAGRLKKPLRARDRDVELLMLLGVYQLMHTRVPAHAAVSTAVDLTRRLDKGWAGKLVNGVLRGVQRELGEPTSRLHAQLHSDLSLRYAQPKWFVRAMHRAWPDRDEAILDALQQRAPMTLRVNTRRVRREDYLEQLREAGIAARPLAEVSTAVVLEQPLAVARLPGFAHGLVSVQDAGAQLAGPLLDLHDGMRVLDACAAPGGKTGHILELAEGLVLTALDVDRERLQRVRENLDRIGRPARLEVGDAARPPAEWQRQPFDRILVDAPCSATGVMRRHPDIRLLRRREDIEALATRQATILDRLWTCLQAGGKLLYATCLLMPQENEELLGQFLQRQADARSIALQVAWGHPRAVGRQTLPGELTMDGFFYALLEKTDG